MNSFKYLEDEATADIAFIAFGDDINTIFENSCCALVEAMIERSSIERIIEVEYRVESEDKKGLLYDLLESIIFKFETEDVLFADFKIQVDEQNNSLNVKAKGENYNPNKHSVTTHIKAITFFGMEFTDKSVKVTLDI